ncbi:hypothetical protein H4R99_002376 [Coemansia sp. RSA 1722]|nr:hypothetical protein LPJ57_003090 [Coemansia sp. RSA 486]KAJ2235238.1 hypothetical protein IWW45_002769 [Coemansia sp. RSA 485]KAJ2603372.1 hypothetical protein H4R99_002376 [Coemansia sp. RSA 1722]KAJ2634623.1 hypothetical protein GGF40_004091 [Coemansia sp. RSA 1286]KAJ2696386.1 hypothetical protein FB645_006219 [Coemansia sp. IMI 203386]
MTRGNQREEARKRNLKKADKQGTKKKGENAGVNLKNKMESDAEIMRQKQAKAALKNAGQTGTTAASK